MARVGKAFNHFGAEIHADPALMHGPTDAYVASDDADAKAEVIALAHAMGFAGKDAGPLRNMRTKSLRGFHDEATHRQRQE